MNDPAVSDSVDDQARRFYAEEVRIAGPVERDEVVDAFAKVPRERFLGPPPWLASRIGHGYEELRGREGRDTYHNVPIAIDPKRKLNNGQPSFLGFLIDRTGAKAGDHVTHVGCGTGYYTAILAEIVGESGLVTAVEIDEDLASRARENLAHLPQVDVVQGDGSRFDSGATNAFLVNAGVTHPAPIWLERMLPGAKLILPLTAEQGMGVVLQVENSSPGMAAKIISPVGIYHCQGGRDKKLGERLASVLRTGFAAWGEVASLRLEPHEEDESCWFHDPEFCISKLTL